MARKTKTTTHATPAGQSAVLSQGLRFSRLQILLLAVILAIIGVFIIYLSHADGSSGSSVTVNFPPIGVAGSGSNTGY